MHEKPRLQYKPIRIISLVPSQTELLFDLGLRDEVIGITKFCIHPNEWFKTKTRIGGTKKLHIDKIIELAPDLILANKEENTKEEIELLQQTFPVYISDIKSIEEAYTMISDIGELVHREAEAIQLISNIKEEQSIHHKILNPQSCIYLIWNQPYMAAGNDTFIHSMLIQAGFSNSVSTNRYPILSNDEIQQLNPSLIFLSSEPYPFKQKHIDELKAICPHAKIKLVDGELFSWYGSRMCQSFKYFRALNEELTV